MLHYYAPLEGLTDSIYRSLHAKAFPGIDRYYTPFLSPTCHRSLTQREERELPLDPGYFLVPQILTKSAEDFLWLAEVCRDRGYAEVNLNLGCPSGTVSAKGKGAGMLRDFNYLNHFLEQIYSSTSLPVSVKTRIGYDNADHFPELLHILNQYPVSELIIHPRIRNDFYNRPLHMDVWEYALSNSSNPLCFNGDLCTSSEIPSFSEKYPSVKAVMLGRALIGDPGMFTPGGTTADTLEKFYDALTVEYIRSFGGSRNAMFRLKENWRYLLCKFEGAERLGKQLRKTTDINEFQHITHEIIHNLPMRAELAADWLP